MKTWLFFALLFVGILLARLCHHGVLWEPETFPLAAATQMLHGKMLYREIWYDKPPLAPVLYWLLHAPSGYGLRIVGAFYALCASFVAYRFAKDLWGADEGLWAAGLMAFFLTFDLPASVLPLGPDLLMVVPHLLAVWMAFRGRPFWSGLAAGVAFLCNVKGLFVLASCALFGIPVLGFLLPCALAAVLLLALGAWPGYLAEVWVWSSAYAGSTFLEHPVWNGVVRTGNWLGFHAALVAGSLYRSIPWRLLAWLAISFTAVALGGRFFPRYYLQLLPPLVIIGSRMMPQRKWIVCILLLVPLVRFGPRYVEQALRKPWSDTVMDQDSREASVLLQKMVKPGNTLFVWGYRPEVWAYTGLRDATPFLDSQPLTGVPADRHLTQSQPVADTRAARLQFARSRPDFLLDGLTPFNPQLAPNRYPELQNWFSQYELVGQTRFTLLYRRRSP